MKKKAQVLVTFAFMAVLSCTYAERHDTPGSGNEIIVKFAADQAVNETITAGPITMTC